jgi:hypothetical protein
VTRYIPVVAAALLAACTGDNPDLTDLQRDVARTEWITVSPEDAWVYLPHTRLVLERRFARVAEQRLLLPNLTVLSGDNFVYLRADTPGFLAEAGNLRLRRVLAQAGGLPAPFTEEDLRILRSREDGAGALTWTEWTSGAGTTCVLALRRLDVADRLLPGRAAALDMVMRNCVPGDAEAALAPAGPEMVAFPAPEGMARGAPVRTLSALAAPSP